MRISPLVMLAPAVGVVVFLFVGGLAFAVTQSSGGWHVLNDPEFTASLLTTLRIASLATVLSAASALLIALALQAEAQSRSGLRALLQIPIAMPHLVMALSAILLLAPSGLVARLLHLLGIIHAPSQFPEMLNDAFGWSIILVYVVKEAPFLALLCLAVLARIDPEMYAVARTLGASRWQRFRFVTLPLLGSTLTAGSMVVFAFIASAFEIPYLLGRPFPSMLGVMAQRKYMSANFSERPEALALALAGACISAGVVLGAYALHRRSPFGFVRQ